MRARSNHSTARVAVLVTIGLILGGCALFRHSDQSAEDARSLVVTNRTQFEVVVYALQSSGSTGMRLGNVSSFGTATISIPRPALQGSGDMVVRVHAIGRSRDWVSPRINLADGEVAKLEVQADANGNMRTSAFYSAPPGTESIP